MVRVRWATQQDAEAIADLVAKSPDASFEHLYEFQEIRAADLGQDPWYAVAEEGRHLVGLLPAVPNGAGLLEGSLEFARSGLVARDVHVARALVDALLDRARQEGLDALLLTLPDRALRRWFPPHLDIDHCTQRAALPATVEELEARLGSKRRNHIKQARRRELVVRSTDPEDLSEWWSIYAGVASRVGQRGSSQGLLLSAPESYASILAAVRPRARAQLVGIHEGEELLGGYFVLTLGRTAYLYRGGVRTDHLGQGTGDLLLLEVFREVIGAGCTEIDLGETSRAGSGLYAFKSAHGGQHVDNSQILCDLSGASAILSDETRRQLAPTPSWTPAFELASFLLGPPLALPDEPVSPGREWIAVSRRALPALALPPLAGADGPTFRAAVVGSEVAAGDLEDLVQRTWALPLPITCAVEGGVDTGWRFASARRLLRRGPPARFAALRPGALLGAPHPAGDAAGILLVVQSRKDVEDLFALAAPGAADGLRLPAEPFAQVPVHLHDGCRLLPTGCPARHLETLHVDEEGVRPCRPGPRVARQGEDVASAVASLDARAVALAERRGCASCPAATEGARARAAGPLRGAASCAPRRVYPRLGTLALLIEGAGRYVARGLRPAAREAFEWRAVEVPGDGSPPPDGAGFPPIPADVIALYVDGRPLACSVRTGTFAEIGDTLAQLLEAGRGARGPARVAALLRDSWDADDDDIQQACAALRSLLLRLEQSRA